MTGGKAAARPTAPAGGVRALGRAIAEAVRGANLRALLTTALIWGVLLALCAVGFSTAAQVGTMFPSISLRFRSPISGPAAYDARQHSIENAQEDAFWPTFWSEETASVSSELATISTNSLAYSGDIFLVWPASFVAGAAPGDLDRGCAISSRLAWRLWGSGDVVGKTLEVDGEDWPVRGVFEGEEDLILLSYPIEDTSRGWAAAELSGGPKNATRDDAKSYASSAGLGSPSSILVGDRPAFLATLLAAVPLLVLAFYGLTAALAWLYRRHPITRGLVWGLLLVALAMMLPSLLDALPDWLIPGQWSDYSFWSSLAGQLGDGLREFFSALPTLRDVEGRLLLVRQIGVAFTAACLSIVACARWHMPSAREP